VARIVDAVTNAVALLRPGETLYRTIISSAARAVDQYSIVEANVVTPAVNVAPLANQVLRVSSVTVTG